MSRKVLVVLHPASRQPKTLSLALTEACALSTLELHLVPDLSHAARFALELQPVLVIFDVSVCDAPVQDCLWQMSKLHNTRSTRKLVLAADATLDERVAALEAGADDFLLKPISARELQARFTALLRPHGTDGASEDQKQLGDLCLYPESLEVVSGDVRAKLTPREFRLLAYLMNSPNRVLGREELLENVWYPSCDIEDRRVVDVYMLRLREKIEDDPARPTRLLTRRGEGYSLVDPER
jgi:two-component system response regulator VicR